MQAKLQARSKQPYQMLRSNSAGQSALQQNADESETSQRLASLQTVANGGQNAVQLRALQGMAQIADDQTSPIQRKGAAEVGTVDVETDQAIKGALGKGQPLEPTIRSKVDGGSDADFSSVRVHNDATTDDLNQPIQAKAFTTGSDVFFPSDECQPGSSARQELLAHEFPHFVQQGGATQLQRRAVLDISTGGSMEAVVQRLYGTGNKGRTREEEKKELAAGTTTADEAVGQIRTLLTRSSRKTNYTHFNKVMAALMRPDIGKVRENYGSTALNDDINAKFGADSFRAEFLHGLARGRTGMPSPISRVCLALGAGGFGAASITSDQAEALRLMNKLSPTDLQLLYQERQTDLKTGLSKLAFKQVKAMVQSAEAIGAGQAEIDAGHKMSGTHELRLLDGLDRELGKLLSRAKKGEATTVFDRLAVKLQFNMGQFTKDLSGWVERVKKLEAVYFGGRPVIRNYVLGIPTTISSDRNGKTFKPAKEKHFLKRMKSRKFLAGWNDGDRVMIKMMISAGTASGTFGAASDTKANTNATSDVVESAKEEASSYDSRTLTLIQQAVSRCDNFRVSTALSAVAAEIVIQNKKGAKSRSDRAVELLAKLGPEDRSALFAALSGALPSDDAELTPNAERLAERLLFDALVAAKTRAKEMMRLEARLTIKTASDAYVIMKRYSAKVSFKAKKFNQLVAKLNRSELTTARNDRMLKHMLSFQATRYEDFDLEACPVTASVYDSGIEFADFDVHHWAKSWSLFITSVKDRSKRLSEKSKKKIYSFALRILDAGGSAGLHKVFTHLEEEPCNRLMKMSLGQALERGDDIGSGGYDIVGKIAKKSQTKRPKGETDTDGIIGSFTSLSGGLLLDEWTNIAEYRSDLAARKSEFDLLVELAHRHDAVDSDADGAEEKRLRLLNEIREHQEQFSKIHQRLASGFHLTMRDDRRAGLNKGLNQLKTSEFFTVNTALAEHLAAQLITAPMRAELIERGLMPSELAMADTHLLFVADKVKEANLSTWHQWAAFTARGQLREESAAILTRQLRDLGAKVVDPEKAGEVKAAKEAFGSARVELDSRTKTFKVTAKKYTERLKKIIGLIIDAAIAATTLGIGAVPALMKTIVAVTTSFTKDMILAVVDKIMMPSESNLLSEAGISAAKNILKSATQFGLDQVIYQLDVSLGLIDSNASGVRGGTYWDDTAKKLITVNAHRFRSAEEYGASIVSNMVSASLSKLTNKLIDTSVAAATTDGDAAWKNMFKNLGLADLVDVTIAPVMSRVLADLKREMMVGISPVKKHTHTDGKDYTVLKDLNTKFADLGTESWMTDNDDTYSTATALPNFGANFGRIIASKAQDKTVFAFIETLQSKSVSAIDAKMKRAMGAHGAVDARSIDSGGADEALAVASPKLFTDAWDEFVDLTKTLQAGAEMTVRQTQILPEAIKQLDAIWPDVPDHAPEDEDVKVSVEKASEPARIAIEG